MPAPPDQNPTNGTPSEARFTEWRRWMEKEMENQHSQIVDLYRKNGAKDVAIAILQVKSGVWGLLGGLLAALAVWLATKGG